MEQGGRCRRKEEGSSGSRASRSREGKYLERKGKIEQEGGIKYWV